MPPAAVRQGASQRRPIQIASTQNPAKMTPSAYMTGTSAPAAITPNWRALPATSAQRRPGRPATAARSTATTASTPPATPATRGAVCPMVMATGMASPITIASMISTVPQSCLTPVPSCLLRGTPGWRGEQQPRVARGDHRSGDEHPGPAHAVRAGRAVGEAHGYLQCVIQPFGRPDPVRPEHLRGQLGEGLGVHGPGGGVPGDHQFRDHRLQFCLLYTSDAAD